MEEIKEHLRDISEIRSMMERNSKFLSLSGLSGVSAGVFGLLGTISGYLFLETDVFRSPGNGYVSEGEFLEFFAITAFLVLLGAVGSALFFSMRMARKRSLPMWNKTAQNTLISLVIPLAAGGVFCMIMALHGHYVFIPALTLLFYGMALLNASKNTFKEIRYLGYSELVLGLLCAAFPLQGLLFWGFGFGVIHIAYGAVMYFKYER